MQTRDQQTSIIVETGRRGELPCRPFASGCNPALHRRFRG